MIRIMPILFTLMLITSCKEHNNSNKVSANESAVHAQFFDIIHRKIGRPIIRIYNPDDRSDITDIDTDELKEIKIISLSATTNGMLDQLDATSTILGISNINYIYSPSILRRHSIGKVTEFGFDSQISIEKIIQSGANIILYSGFGDEFPGEQQLSKLGIITIPIYDWREENALGKAEWIKLIGVLIGKQKEASEYFEAVEAKYNELLSLKKDFGKRPIVLSGNMEGDQWWAPGGNSFFAQMIKDAGGEYLFKNTTENGSIGLTMEEILDNNISDIWINPGFRTKKEILANNSHCKRISSFDSIYCYSPNMNKYWEQAAVQPHFLLEDLMAIFQPEIKGLNGNHFYSKIN